MMQQFVIYDCPENYQTNELYGPFKSDADIVRWIEWMQNNGCKGTFTITSASDPYYRAEWNKELV